jgi:hypothetical protein
MRSNIFQLKLFEKNDLVQGARMLYDNCPTRTGVLPDSVHQTSLKVNYTRL